MGELIQRIHRRQRKETQKCPSEYANKSLQELSNKQQKLSLNQPKNCQKIVDEID